MGTVLENLLNSSPKNCRKKGSSAKGWADAIDTIASTSMLTTAGKDPQLSLPRDSPEKGSCARAVPQVRNAAGGMTAAMADIAVKLFFQCLVMYVFMYFHPRYFCHILYSTTGNGHRFLRIPSSAFFLFENRRECASQRVPASITDRIMRTILSPVWRTLP